MIADMRELIERSGGTAIELRFVLEDRDLEV